MVTLHGLPLIKRPVLLLTYTPLEFWSGQRVPPPRSSPWQGDVLLARLWPRNSSVNARAGVEPATCYFKDRPPYRYGVPGSIKIGPGVRNRTSYPLRAPALQAGSDPTRSAGMVETDRNRTGIARLQGGSSPVELRPRMLGGPSGGCTRASAVRMRRSPADPMGPWSHGESHPDFEDAVLA